jgi:hypothetical protein
VPQYHRLHGVSDIKVVSRSVRYERTTDRAKQEIMRYIAKIEFAQMAVAISTRDDEINDLLPSGSI